MGSKEANELGLYDMSGNGAGTGIEPTTVLLKRILTVHPPALAECYKAAAGTMVNSAAGLPIGATATRTTCTTTAGREEGSTDGLPPGGVKIMYYSFFP